MSHTLLLADDSVTIQRVIELTFADEDVNVVAVSDGDEAIAVLDTTPPDIVLADVGMPGRSGYEVAQHIRDTPRLSHIPVVLLTGAFEPIDHAKATAAGCDGVLAKPFEPQLVIGRVKELLAKPKAPSSDRPLAAPPPAEASRTPSLVDTTRGSTPQSRDAGDYFDRLDRAFANLSAEPADADQAGVSPSGATALDWFASQPPPADLMQGGSASALPDRWDAPPAGPTSDPPLSYAPAPPPPPFDVIRGRPFDVTQPFDYAQGGVDVAQSTPLDPTISRSSRAWPRDYAQSRPDMSQSFDSAPGRPLDVPQRRPAPPPPPAPTLPPLADAFAALLAAEQVAPPSGASPIWPSPQQSAPVAAVSDDVIEQVTRLVLDRLTDRVVRETVAEKVSEVAERLVQEEIERIKASIK